MDSKPDTILERNLELNVRIKSAQNLYEITIEDNSGILEAATASNKIFQILKEKNKSREYVKVKGFLIKTEYENLSFEIEEILE